jgi:hypothetical protein
MCIICVDITKNKLTSVEARRNLGEMHEALAKDHVLDLLHLIWQKEDEEFQEEYDVYLEDQNIIASD